MAIYHFTAATASRAGGQSARAHAGYIARLGKYAGRKRDALVFCESFNMPAWADGEAAALAYWQAADEFERANGRLYKGVEFALPIELEPAERIKLARAFARELACVHEGKLPVTLAVHAGGGHNPHAHLMVSERVNDGHQREASAWFARAASGRVAAQSGGARKTTELKPREWLGHMRARWAELANQFLAGSGIAARIDHRSNAERGVSHQPGEHLGPVAGAIAKRGRSRRAADQQASRDVNGAAVESLKIIELEAARARRELAQLRGAEDAALPDLKAELAKQFTRQAAIQSQKQQQKGPTHGPSGPSR